MNFKQHIFYGLVVSLIATVSYGDLITYEVDTAIPDNAGSGLQDTRIVSGLGNVIESVNVYLNIEAMVGDVAWNGDFYVTLQHDSGFSVLLNRTGKTTWNPLGYSDNGFDITFTLGGSDIHSYQNSSPTFDDGQLTGTWGVDGRNVDPDNVIDTDARSALLSSFSGLDANGGWTLFVADLSGNGNAKLVSWGLDIQAIPEPTTIALIGMTGLIAIVINRWKTLR
jgi:subtilisin-like proprotein convertase family protein